MFVAFLALYLLLRRTTTLRIIYVTAISLFFYYKSSGLYFLLLGIHHKQCAQRLSCRTAAASSSPYRVTLDEGKWNGRDTYSKWSGEATGFGQQIQMADGAERIYRLFCPLILISVTVYSLGVNLYISIYLNPSHHESSLQFIKIMYSSP